MTARPFGSLQAGRGIAALAVVYHHEINFMGADPRFWKDPHYLFFQGGSLGVEFFFVLSGIVIMMAHWGDIGVPTSIPRYLWKRFRRIYPMYWVVLAVMELVYLGKPGSGTGFERDAWVMFSSILLVHVHSLNSVLLVAWTLFHEIMFYTVFAVVLMNRRLGLAVVCLWLAGSLLMLLGVSAGPWAGEVFSYLHLLFGFGMLSVWLLQRTQRLAWKPPLALGAGMLGYIFAWCLFKGSPPTPQIVVLTGLGSALLMVGMIELERREQLKVWGWLLFLGDASYSIYLVHRPVLSFCTSELYRLSRTFHLPTIVCLPVSIVAATLAGIAIHLVVERPLLNHISTVQRRKLISEEAI